MGEILAQWVKVGEQNYQRTELYGQGWCEPMKSFQRFVAAPFGGPILVVHENEIHMHKASGPLLYRWKWRSPGTRIVTCSWSHCEEAVFVMDDGQVMVYSLFGDLIRTTSMGQEAKDIRVKEARIFFSAAGTGVAALTTSNRFFVVNNLLEPKVRKMCDVDLSGTHFPWAVYSGGERHAKILVGIKSSLMIVSLNDVTVANIDTVPFEKKAIADITVASDKLHLCLRYTSGLIWLGNLDGVKLCQVMIDFPIEMIMWCGIHSVVCFSGESAQCLILTTSGIQEQTFLPGFIDAVQEIDGIRVFSLYSQELVTVVPESLNNIFSIGSVSPGAQLRLAADEFYVQRSHRADEYIRAIADRLPEAVNDCIEGAGMLHNPLYQKELMRAAQFGKSFMTQGGNCSAADAFLEMCKTLRVLNGLRHYQVGIPLTLDQYIYLTPQVVIDRLLARHLYPLAMKICDFLNLPTVQGTNRVLAHWACYKVACQEEDSAIAKAISTKLGLNRPQISYCDIASKAAECGKKELSIKLLEHEVSVMKQVPLLVQLGQESSALSKALKSGDRDLAYSVILHLRRSLSSSDFHMMIRKFPLGKTLYQVYCKQHDEEALQDFHVQEDDFLAQAQRQLIRAYAATRCETRLAILVACQELFHKAKNEQLKATVDENHQLLKLQHSLEDRFAGTNFVGQSVHQTLEALLHLEETKLADKMKQDFKIGDRRYTWLKAKTWARYGKWSELKKLAKQKKLSIGVANIVKLAKKHGGQEAAKQFLTEEFMNNEDKFNLLTELGLYLDAAATAFSVKNVDALNTLEALCAGRDDILAKIQLYKSKLILK